MKVQATEVVRLIVMVFVYLYGHQMFAVKDNPKYHYHTLLPALHNQINRVWTAEHAEDCLKIT